MNLSEFFRTLRSAYRAELDDLRTDSEGRDVLAARLREKRSQITFLCQMMESAPEMVAVAFHGGFRFERPAVWEHVLTLEPDDLPVWDALSDTVHLAPWAAELASVVLAQPQGAHFMTLAATLEYLAQRHPGAEHVTGNAARDDDDDGAFDERPRFDGDDDTDARDLDHDGAGADWLEGQGFERKE